MTYTPTKKELDELGFEFNGFYQLYEMKGIGYEIDYDSKKNLWRFGTGILEEIYPKSIDDIKTLIRILTPQ